MGPCPAQASRSRFVPPGPARAVTRPRPGAPLGAVAFDGAATIAPEGRRRAGRACMRSRPRARTTRTYRASKPRRSDAGRHRARPTGYPPRCPSPWGQRRVTPSPTPRAASCGEMAHTSGFGSPPLPRVDRPRLYCSPAAHRALRSRPRRGPSHWAYPRRHRLGPTPGGADGRRARRAADASVGAMADDAPPSGIDSDCRADRRGRADPGG